MTAQPKFVVSNEEFENLIHRFTRDVTALAKVDKFDVVTGRDTEIDLMTLILLQRIRKNILLLGEPGVGKTSLFVGLGQWIAAGKVPKQLMGARLIELEMSMISAGSSVRADFEGRLMSLIKGAAERNTLRNQPPIIFAIDEIHQLMTSFKASSFSGAIDIMKPYMTVGDLYIVGATTHEEYEGYVQADPAIDRRLQKIPLSVPDLNMTLKIILSIKPNYEKHYGITIPRECCVRIVKLSEKFLRKRNNPDKSILLLDLACAYAVKGDKAELTDEAVRVAVAAEASVDVSAVPEAAPAAKEPADVSMVPAAAMKNGNGKESAAVVAN